ncbi:tripartite tricarboxylate transporter substrate binding protein [Halomarina halobia]|uniref:Tripartite tricarboxylate transporter substrate binding protein n=1 Tax=Halomarina halobia TaxID=3033386 RepID=A0ABD6ADU9_9EURY|nr:tripartite tricarboxylate transporter substrate binding protein [Halomarina sp. PSR21]
MNRRTFIKAGIGTGAIGLAGCVGSLPGEGGGGGGGNDSGGGSYPSKEITVIVPWAQGGGTDRSTRALTPTWSKKIGANFVVQNYPGGSTQVGGENLYNATPDGYTVAMWNLPQMQATWLFQDAPYTADDFDFIGTNHWDPTMWFAPKDVPYEDMKEFIDYAKENSVTVGTTAAIGNTALSALLVKDTYDVKMKLVNMEGGTPTRQAVLAGDVDAAVNQPWAFNPSNIGKVTSLGSHTPEPQELWPDTPSFKELGLTDLPRVEEGLGQWKLQVTPGGLKDEYPDRFEKLVTSYEEAMKADEYRQRAKEQGNLDKILRYNGPEKTQEIVDENTEFMREYKPLFDEFQQG